MDAIKNFLASTDLVGLLTSFAINLVIAIFIFVIGKWLARKVENTLKKILRKRGVEDVLVDLVSSLKCWAATNPIR